LISVLATITDETAPLTAELTLLDPIGATCGPVGTAVKGDEHSALIDIDPDGDGVVEAGDWSWTLTATDGFGNIGTASGITTVSSSQPCP